MKVLHFYRTYFPDTQGGLEETIRQICIGTAESGVESRVLTLSPNPHPDWLKRPEAEVLRTRLNLDIASCSMSAGSFRAFRDLAKWADLIHFHFPWPFADLVRYWVKPDAPNLITYHSDIVRQRILGKLYLPLMSNFLENSSAIVATSPNYLESSPVLKRYSSKVEVIPIGVDEKSHPQVDPVDLQRTKNEFGTDFFLFVGVLRRYKGLHFLLEAIRGAPYQVVIVGSGPEEAQLRRRAYEGNIRNVRFTGYLPDIDKLALLQLSLGMIFPSHLRSEAFGVSLLEGAIMGKPLISTEIGTGTSYININGETGLVVSPADPLALRRAMDQLYANPVEAQRMGANARSRYLRYFTAARMGRAYSKLYDRIAATSTGKKSRHCTVSSVDERENNESAI